MTERSKWSEDAWQAALPVYQEILELPFVRQLAEGTLTGERFRFYIEQDSIYVENYCHVLAHIASRLTRQEHVADFLKFASVGIEVEKILHETYIGAGHASVSPTPTTLLYNCYESAKGLGPVEIEAASILPCFWVYQKVGEHIFKTSSPDNPYYRWIETYADKDFEKSTLRAIEICDELAENASAEIRRQMRDAFVMATRMEWMFWDSAYNLEKWKI
ncbi:MAG: TenA family protein [Muribaculaceae bacterium]|nr:TenA family protein [Muribaculaceae bacterium]